MAIEIITIALVMIIGELGSPGGGTFIKSSNFVRVIVGAGVILSIGTIVAWLTPGSLGC